MLIRAITATILAAGCGNLGTPPTVDCSQVTIPTYSQLTIWPLCTSCHSSAASGGARHGAPGGVNYDTYDSARAAASIAASTVNSGIMPGSGQPAPTEEQKSALFAWALCGSPQ
jgi:uncharacterized membrane protein